MEGPNRALHRGNMVITPDHKFRINQFCLGAKWVIVDIKYIFFLSLAEKPSTEDPAPPPPIDDNFDEDEDLPEVPGDDEDEDEDDEDDNDSHRESQDEFKQEAEKQATESAEGE